MLDMLFMVRFLALPHGIALEESRQTSLGSESRFISIYLRLSNINTIAAGWNLKAKKMNVFEVKNYHLKQLIKQTRKLSKAEQSENLGSVFTNRIWNTVGRRRREVNILQSTFNKAAPPSIFKLWISQEYAQQDATQLVLRPWGSLSLKNDFREKPMIREERAQGGGQEDFAKTVIDSYCKLIQFIPI